MHHVNKISTIKNERRATDTYTFSSLPGPHVHGALALPRAEQDTPPCECCHDNRTAYRHRGKGADKKAARKLATRMSRIVQDIADLQQENIKIPWHSLNTPH